MSARSRAALRQANAAQTARAQERDAEIFRAALDAAGPGCPGHLKRVAEARILSPGVSWSQIGAALGMTKDQATGCARQLLKLYGGAA
jgi:DNA-binding transcriptional regulator WhiA